VAGPGRRFVKGQSGNPKGRPRRPVVNLRAEAAQYTGTALAVLAEIAVNRRCAALARVRACRELIVSAHGLPPQALSVEQLPPPGEAPSVRFVFVSKRPDGSEYRDDDEKPVPDVARRNREQLPN
jgi:hypothetical protein